MKKVICFAISLFIIIIYCAPAFSAEEEIYYSADGFTARLERSSKVLTVSGKGRMGEYSNYRRPVWYNLRDSISSVVIEEGVTGIGSYSFYGLTSLKSVSLPETLETVGDFAFAGCVNLESIVFPESVTYIGRYAVSGCTYLNSAVLPEKLSSLSEGVLYKASYLTFVKLPESCPVIEDRAIQGAPRLEAVELPEDLEYIGDYALDGASKITSISLPESLKYIGDYALTCIGGTEIVIPPSVEHIGYNAFRSSKWFMSLPDGINAVNGITLTYKGSAPEDEIAIPWGARTVSVKTCFGLTTVKSVIIPDSVSVIEERALYDMPSLQEITVPDSVVSIGDKALGYIIDANGNDCVVPYFTVFGHAGHEGERYAEENGFDFVCTHEETEPCRADCTVGESVDVECKWCGEKLYTMHFPAKEHRFGEVVTIQPTCTEGGKTWRECFECGKELIISETAPLGHVPEGSFEIDTFPGCTEAGSISKKCSRCGGRCEIRAVEPTGHRAAESFECVSAPTCTEDGEEALFCTVCGTVMETRVIPATGHEQSDWVVLTRAKPGYYGFRIKECISCGVVLEYENYIETFVTGDVDGNNKISISDLLTLRKSLAGLYNFDFAPESADINGDGKLSISDVAALRKLISGN